MTSGMDDRLVHELTVRENATFRSARPRGERMWRDAAQVMPNGVPMTWLRTSYEPVPLFASEGRGARFRDVDGHEYADFNIADMSMFTGYAPEPVVAAVARQVAAGSQFLLPGEDAAWVAAELGRRYRLPLWQFTLSATHANSEAIRIARVLTGRERVLFFDGHYHGHFDESLVGLVDARPVPEEGGLPADVIRRVVVVPFNDLTALAAALAGGDVAAVVTEPAMTNNVGLVMPEPDFHQGLRDLTRASGAQLVLDETHTQVVGPGGLTRMWDLDPDIVTIGKSIAAGIPLGAYGMTPLVAEVLQRPLGRDDPKQTVATGGTLFGNPLSMAAARATMGELLTDEAYAGSRARGSRLADGLTQLVASTGLPWSVHRFWPRSGLSFTPAPPIDGATAVAGLDVPLRRLMRVYLANRGVWEAIVGAGPTCSIACTDDDVDQYLTAIGELLAELTA